MTDGLSKPIFIVGLFGSSLGTWLVALSLQGAISGWYPMAWAGMMLALARGVYSATASAIYPSSSAYIADVTDRASRAQGMAVIGGANSLGSVLGPAIGGGLAFMGLLVPMYVVGAITFLGAIWAIYYLKEPAKHAEARKPSNIKFSDPRLRPFLIMWASFFLVFISLNVVTAFYIRDKFGITDPAEVAQTAAIALVAMASVIIIGTTVRMTVLHRAREIRIMRLVGATDSFIRRPFLLDGMVKGAVGGLAAVALNFAAFMLVNQMFRASFFTLRQGIILVVFGTLLGLVASALSVGRHLLKVQTA